VDHAGFLPGQPQPQRGQDGGCLFAQRLGMGTGAVDQDDPIVGLCRVPYYADRDVEVLVRALYRAAGAA